jgi:hypothetical protein
MFLPTYRFFLCYWGLNSGPHTLNHSTSPFLWFFLKNRFSWTICPGWLWNAILLISAASWVAKIVVLSQLHQAQCTDFCRRYKGWQKGEVLREEPKFPFGYQASVHAGAHERWGLIVSSLSPCLLKKHLLKLVEKWLPTVQPLTTQSVPSNQAESHFPHTGKNTADPICEELVIQPQPPALCKLLLQPVPKCDFSKMLDPTTRNELYMVYQKGSASLHYNFLKTCSQVLISVSSYLGVFETLRRICQTSHILQNYVHEHGLIFSHRLYINCWEFCFAICRCFRNTLINIDSIMLFDFVCCGSSG